MVSFSTWGFVNAFGIFQVSRSVVLVQHNDDTDDGMLFSGLLLDESARRLQPERD